MVSRFKFGATSHASGSERGASSQRRQARLPILFGKLRLLLQSLGDSTAFNAYPSMDAVLFHCHPRCWDILLGMPGVFLNHFGLAI